MPCVTCSEYMQGRGRKAEGEEGEEDYSVPAKSQTTT